MNVCLIFKYCLKHKKYVNSVKLLKFLYTGIIKKKEFLLNNKPLNSINVAFLKILISIKILVYYKK